MESMGHIRLPDQTGSQICVELGALCRAEPLVVMGETA